MVRRQPVRHARGALTFGASAPPPPPPAWASTDEVIPPEPEDPPAPPEQVAAAEAMRLEYRDWTGRPGTSDPDAWVRAAGHALAVAAPPRLYVAATFELKPDLSASWPMPPHFATGRAHQYWQEWREAAAVTLGPRLAADAQAFELSQWRLQQFSSGLDRDEAARLVIARHAETLSALFRVCLRTYYEIPVADWERRAAARQYAVAPDVARKHLAELCAAVEDTARELYQ